MWGIDGEGKTGGVSRQTTSGRTQGERCGSKQKQELYIGSVQGKRNCYSIGMHVPEWNLIIQDYSGEMTGEEEDSRDLASFGWRREGEKNISSDHFNYYDEKLFLPSVKHNLNALICIRCKAEDSCLYPHPR